MQIEDFEPLIKNGMSAMNIVKEINKRKERIVISEKPVKTPVIVPQFEEPNIDAFARTENNGPTFEEEVKVPTPIKEIIHEKPENKAEKMYFIEMRVQGNIDKITTLSHFLKNNDYEFIKSTIQ